MTSKLSNSDKSPKYKKKEYKRKICEASRHNEYKFVAEIKCYWAFEFLTSRMSGSLPVKFHDAETYFHFVVCCNKYHG